MLVVYHPDAGTDAADKLTLLASAMLTPLQDRVPASPIAGKPPRT